MRGWPWPNPKDHVRSNVVSQEHFDAAGVEKSGDLNEELESHELSKGPEEDSNVNAERFQPSPLKNINNTVDTFDIS